MTTPDPKNPTITIGEFFARHSESLQMSVSGADTGFDRRIKEPTINRPGLALAGFYSYFAEKRIQVLGSAELSYLRSLQPAEMKERCQTLCERPIPGLVVSRGFKVPVQLQEAAETAGVALFRTSMVTMKFMNAATMALEFDFAPQKSEYGSMVDILGVGTLIRGSSGIGKSECVLGLVERGHSLVSDDSERAPASKPAQLGRNS